MINPLIGVVHAGHLDPESLPDIHERLVPAYELLDALGTDALFESRLRLAEFLADVGTEII